MIQISIDVTLLDKSRFKEHKRKNGQTAKFCDLILIPTPNGEYGDFMVKESMSKEEREAGKQLPILGNGRNLERRTGGPSAKHSAPEEPPVVDDQEVPF